MNISELKAGQGKVDITVKVKEKKDVRVMEKYGKELKLCNTIVSDDSGDIAMTLWNDEVDKVKQGDTLKISNGYVSEFNGQKQLSAGKYGKLEVVGAVAGAVALGTPAKKDEKKSSKKDDEEVEERDFDEDEDIEEPEEDIEDVEF